MQTCRPAPHLRLGATRSVWKRVAPGLRRVSSRLDLWQLRSSQSPQPLTTAAGTTSAHVGSGSGDKHPHARSGRQPAASFPYHGAQSRSVSTTLRGIPPASLPRAWPSINGTSCICHTRVLVLSGHEHCRSPDARRQRCVCRNFARCHEFHAQIATDIARGSSCRRRRSGYPADRISPHRCGAGRNRPNGPRRPRWRNRTTWSNWLDRWHWCGRRSRCHRCHGCHGCHGCHWRSRTAGHGWPNRC